MTENEPDPLRRIPTKRPAEIHSDVGALLREERLKRGQSLESVAQQSRIPKRYLEALENDRLDEFPAFVYMRGFLKAYCEHLEIPFDPLWSKILTPVAQAATAPAQADIPTTSVASNEPAHAPAPEIARAAPAAAAAPEPAAPSSATGAMVFALALFVGLAIWMFNDRRPASPVHDAENTPRALRPLPRVIEPKFAMRAAEDAWVRVLVDETVVFEGRMPRGAAMEWKPVRVVSFFTTAPAALQLTLNGSPLPLPQPSSAGEYRIDVL